jgi:predicted Zn-dependent peptidase
MKRLTLLGLLAALAGVPAAPAQDIQVHTLRNGMKFLFVPRRDEATVACGWIARVGSVNERPGITGAAHLFEHMMFKGSRTIGTRNAEKDLELMAELDRVKTEIAREEESLAQRERLGEIGEASDPAHRTARHTELLARFAELSEREHELAVKDEFDRVYSSHGASGMNAGTTHDYTIYFVVVPANKLELWFWMESDRLLSPVFREFYSERDVVREERRLRVESTPTGKYEEQFDALFWASSPYSWPVIGWPSDVEAITREEAMEFFNLYYAPGNLTACLVGNLDPGAAVALAEKYFSRIPAGARSPPRVRTREVKQLAEVHMDAVAPSRPQVVIRYHTVPDGHLDEPALLCLEGVLSGRSGRLYKSLVLEQRLASQVDASQEGRKYDGYFEIEVVAASNDAVETSRAALDEMIASLQREPVAERELQRVKNQHAAREYRRQRSSFELLLEILVRDATRSWETIRTDPPRIQAVSPADVQRVAEKYLRLDNRAVLMLRSPESGTGAAATRSKAEGGGAR